MKHSPHISPKDADHLNLLIGKHPDYPKPGILFRDVTPLLGDENAFYRVIEAMHIPFALHTLQPRAPWSRKIVTHVVGIESRGFIFGGAMASRLHAGFVPIRKDGAKLPGTLERKSYALEYGEATLVIQKGALKPGDRVVIVDDLLATGGSAMAATELVKCLGAEVVGYSFAIELLGLGGAKRLGGNVHSVLSYENS